MKILSLVTGIVILAIMCSPVMAISKSDLMAYYRTNPSSLFDTPKLPDTPAPTTTPTVLPTPQPTALPFPKWPDQSFLKPFGKPDIPSSPIVKPTITPAPTPAARFSAFVPCPPYIPIGKLHACLCECVLFRNDTTGEVIGSDCINPATGYSYPIASDDMGTTFIVKEGCPAIWADE
jgi:hypothetical protein